MSESSKIYKQDHTIAKTVIFCIVVLLLVVNRDLDMVELDILAVFVWLFGVNPIAYLVESLRKHPHNHDKI